MFDKQEVRIIVNNSNAFSYVAACLASFKKDEKDRTDFVRNFTDWYWKKSKKGKKPVGVKTKMSFEDLTTFIYGVNVTSNVGTKIFCENGVFVLQ